MNTPALERLRAFRHAIYTTFGCRRDALVEILDGLLTTPVIEHPVHLSLAPGFQRTWGSIYDAQKAGHHAAASFGALGGRAPVFRPALPGMPSMPASGRAAMPQPVLTGAPPIITRVSPTVSPSSPAGTIPGLRSFPNVALVGPRSSRVRRISPGENVNQVSAEQIRSFLSQRGSGQPRPTFTFDAGYEPVQLGALAGLDVNMHVASALRPLFLCRPTTGTDWRTSAAAWGQVRL